MWTVNFRLDEVRDMKWDTWQRTSDTLPTSGRPLLFIVENTMYYGEMRVHESNDSDGEIFQTHRLFCAFPQIKEKDCCEGHPEPIAVEMIDRMYEFKASQVRYWIPIPVLVKD